MKKKMIWQSKVMWINLIGVAAAVVNECSGKLIPDNIAVGILGAINIINMILRPGTDTKLAIKADKPIATVNPGN